MYRNIQRASLLLLLGGALAVAGGAEPARLRDLATDRPDQTESPYTVDAGHWQVEMDVANLTLDDTDGVRTRAWSVAATNLKFGLTPRLDVQLLFEPYVHVRVEDRITGATQSARGLGDVTTRLKFNFWGNDSGPTALAIMPFVKWPLSASEIRNGETEGGVILPFAVDLGQGWGLGAMTEVDFVSDGANGHDFEWINTVVVGRDFTDRWGGYLEFVAVTGDAPGFRWQGQVDCGFTYALTESAQLDFGCNFGITEAAPDYQPFVGYSQRF